MVGTPWVHNLIVYLPSQPSVDRIKQKKGQNKISIYYQ